VVIEPVPAPTATNPNPCPRTRSERPISNIGHYSPSNSTSSTSRIGICQSDSQGGSVTPSHHPQQTFPSLPSSPNYLNSPQPPHQTLPPRKQKAAHSSLPQPAADPVTSIEPYAIYSTAMRSLINVLNRFGYWVLDILGMSRVWRVPASQ